MTTIRPSDIGAHTPDFHSARVWTSTDAMRGPIFSAGCTCSWRLSTVRHTFDAALQDSRNHVDSARRAAREANRGRETTP